jgi:hypothetical protein
MPHMIWAELFLLICTKDAKYGKYRSQFLKAGSKTTAIVISAISGLVGRKYGVAPAGCVPIVASVLACLVKVGKEAFCKQIRQSLPAEAVAKHAPNAPTNKRPRRETKKQAVKPKKKPRKGT